jgi:hypothetical protein
MLLSTTLGGDGGGVVTPCVARLRSVLGINEHWEHVAFANLSFFDACESSTTPRERSSDMCITVTTYTEHPCGAAVFSGRSHVRLVHRRAFFVFGFLTPTRP